MSDSIHPHLHYAHSGSRWVTSLHGNQVFILFISTCQGRYLAFLSTVVPSLLSPKELFSDYSTLSWLQKLFCTASFIWLNWICPQIHYLVKKPNEFLQKNKVKECLWSHLYTSSKKMRAYIKVSELNFSGGKNSELPIFGKKYFQYFFPNTNQWTRIIHLNHQYQRSCHRKPVLKINTTNLVTIIPWQNVALILL